MELIQSFLLSVTRVRLSLYEQRILTKIVEHGQSVIQGLSVQQYKYITNPFDNEKITIPIRYILSDGSKDYKKVIDACKGLMNRKFEFYEPKTRTYYADTIVHNVIHVAGSGAVTFQVSRVLYDVMFNFELGYKNYDLEQALTLPTPYAVRMYVLLNNQDRPITWSVERLKNMFGVADKYTQTADFIKKVIEPARKALVKSCANNFTYTRIYDGQKVTDLQFFPVKVDERARRLYGDLSKEQITQVVACKMYLKDDVGFTSKEIGANKKTIEDFARIPDAVTILYRINKRAMRKSTNTKGYFISAMRSEYQEWQQALKSLPHK